MRLTVGLTLWCVSLSLATIGHAAPQAAATPPKGSLVVGIRGATATIARAVAAKLPAKLLQMERTGAYLVVLPRKGVTAAALAKLDPRISHVEEVIEMGATFRLAREAAQEK